MEVSLKPDFIQSRCVLFCAKSAIIFNNKSRMSNEVGKLIIVMVCLSQLIDFQLVSFVKFSFPPSPGH